MCPSGSADSGWTTDPGAPHPDLRVTHEYRHVGPVTVRADVRWSGSYSVDGGDWAPIPGVLQTTGTPRSLVVWEARSELIAGDDE